MFDDSEIRAAERAMEHALESPDRTAWVYEYTEDALFVAEGAPTAEGRAELLKMAKGMNQLSSVSIRASRTEGSGPLAYTYGHASWVSGHPAESGRTVRVRFTMVWRKEADGKWRLALELLQSDPPPPQS
jgi:ketosteroid isomerase-like protein